MKNKEIEELLNDIKRQLTIDEKLSKEIAQDFHKTTLNYKETKLLLSYIETLENRNKELYEGFMATQEELTEYATKNEQLKNNKEKEYVLVGRMQLKTRDYIHQLEREKRQLENNRDKAIEYVEHHKFNKFGDIDCNEAEDIIDILKGDRNE